MNSLAQLTADLIRFQSVDAPGNGQHLERVVDFVEQYCTKLKGVFVKRMMLKGKPFLAVTFRPNHKTPALFLNGHLDVVPAEKHQFTPQLKGNRLYGRGAQDMKSGCAVMMALIEHFSRQTKKPDVGFLFVTDEENYGHQSHWLLQKGYKPKLIIMVEPTGGDILIETKGVLRLEGTLPGKAVHSAKPWLGKHPVEAFSQGLPKFYKNFPPLKAEQWRTSATMNEVHAGDCYNRLPSELVMRIDVRYVPKDKPADIVKKIKSCFPREAKWKIILCDPPHRKAKDMSGIQRLQKVARRHGFSGTFTREPFATDARFFADGGVPAAVFGAKGDGMHSKNEWVDVRSMEKVFKTLQEFCGEV